MKRMLLLCLLSSVFGCKGGGADSSGSPLFRLWTSDHSTATRNLTGKSIGSITQFTNNGCTYEIRYEGTESEFTKKTVDVTSPVDPTCFDYTSTDERYYYGGGASLRVCYIDGSQWTPSTTDGCGRLH